MKSRKQAEADGMKSRQTKIVCTRLKPAEHDRVCQLAQQRGINITAAVRMLVLTGLELSSYVTGRTP